MAFSEHLEIFLMLVVGCVLAVGITVLVLRKMGLVDFAKAPENGAPLSQGLLADTRLDGLSSDEQRRLLAKVRWHPLVLIWLFGSIGGFAWFATGSNEMLDFINRGSRSAALIGIVLLVVVFVGLKFLYHWLIGRAIARLSSD
jgi:hypothetical protein